MYRTALKIWGEAQELVHCRSTFDTSALPPGCLVGESSSRTPPLPPNPVLKAYDDRPKNISLCCFLCGGIRHIASMCPQKKLVLVKGQDWRSSIARSQFSRNFSYGRWGWRRWGFMFIHRFNQGSRFRTRPRSFGFGRFSLSFSSFSFGDIKKIKNL